MCFPENELTEVSNPFLDDKRIIVLKPTVKLLELIDEHALII
jgi:hypothetical protein